MKSYYNCLLFWLAVTNTARAWPEYGQWLDYNQRDFLQHIASQRGKNDPPTDIRSNFVELPRINLSIPIKEQLQQLGKSYLLADFIPCRGKETQAGGIVNKKTGACVLLTKKQAFFKYQLYAASGIMYFRWEKKDGYWGDQSLRAHIHDPDSRNCHRYDQQYCRYWREMTFHMGIVDQVRNVCAGMDGDYSEQYQVLLYELGPLSLDSILKKLTIFIIAFSYTAITAYVLFY